MRSWLVCLALLVVPPAAHAQNKCVDAKGKVTYQQDPCPGSVRAPVQAPAAPAKPAAVAASPGRSEAAALAEQGRCVSDWEVIAAALQRGREEIAAQRAEGEDSTREEQVSKQYMEAAMPRFLSACGKYGFGEVRDEGSIQVNAAAARGLQRRIDEAREAGDAAASREAKATDAKSAKLARKDCGKAGQEITQRRVALEQMPVARRADAERALGELYELWKQTCTN